MNFKNLSTKNIIQLIIGFILLAIAIFFSLKEPSTILNPVNIDYDKKTFSGTFPVILFIASIVFLWFGSKDKKDELADAKDALNKAAATISGKFGNLIFRFGQDTIQENIKQGYKNNKLTGKYSVRYKGEIIKDGKIKFFEDAVSRTIMAEFNDIPFESDYLIAFEINDGINELRGSESLKVRIANLNG